MSMPPPVFSNADIEVLELGGGAWRTIQGHVRRWERYRTSVGNHPHPFTTEPLFADLLQVERATCGPTVIPSFCATVRWLSGRLRVPSQDLPSHIVSRLQERLLERRGVETRDSRRRRPWTLSTFGHLENLVIECSAKNVFKSTFAWQCLVMTWASMRFDDALHTCPSTVCLRDEGLHLTAWQTKVDRVCRGTRYAVPKASLGQEDWVTTGYGCWFTVGTDDYQAGDHWLYDVGDFNCLNPNVITNDVFVTSLRRVLYEATMKFAPESQREALVDGIKDVTGHSLRAAVVNFMAKTSISDTLAMMLQGHWKGSKMPEKYLRDRTSLALRNVSHVIKDFKELLETRTPSKDLTRSTAVTRTRTRSKSTSSRSTRKTHSLGTCPSRHRHSFPHRPLLRPSPLPGPSPYPIGSQRSGSSVQEARIWRTTG